MKLCIHFFTPLARFVIASALFRVFDLRRGRVGLLILTLSVMLELPPIAIIVGVFSVFTAALIGSVLFLALLFLAFAGTAAPIAEEVLEKAAQRPPQTSSYQNDLAPRFVSFFSHATTPDPRPPRALNA